MKDEWKTIIENEEYFEYCKKNYPDLLSLIIVEVRPKKKILIKKAFLGKPAEIQ